MLFLILNILFKMNKVNNLEKIHLSKIISNIKKEIYIIAYKKSQMMENNSFLLELDNANLIMKNILVEIIITIWNIFLLEKNINNDIYF